MIAVAIFPVFCFLFLKLNLFSALHLSSVLPFPSADWALIDCVINRKVGSIIIEAILCPSERYQTIQDNPEYNSVLPFRIIPNIIAVNMLIVCIIVPCSHIFMECTRDTEKQLCWNHTLAWMFSCKFAAYFQNTFY